MEKRIWKLPRLVDYLKKMLTLAKFWNIIESYGKWMEDIEIKNKIEKGGYYLKYGAQDNKKYLKEEIATIIEELQKNYNIVMLKSYNIEWIENIYCGSTDSWGWKQYELKLILYKKENPTPQILIDEIIKNPDLYIESLSDFNPKIINDYDYEEIKTYIKEQNFIENLIYESLWEIEFVHDQLFEYIKKIEKYYYTLKVQNSDLQHQETIKYYIEDVATYINNLDDIEKWISSFLKETKFVMANEAAQINNSRNNLISKLKNEYHVFNELQLPKIWINAIKKEAFNKMRKLKSYLFEIILSIQKTYRFNNVSQDTSDVIYKTGKWRYYHSYKCAKDEYYNYAKNKYSSITCDEKGKELSTKLERKNSIQTHVMETLCL